MQLKHKILIDTDIGDNMDDAFAIFAAMAQNFEIVGITTVFRDTVKRAVMVKKLLRSYGGGYESVPVYAGFPGEEADQNDAYLCSFDEAPDDALYPPESTDPQAATDFIIDCCNRYGKELAILAIGPFSNLAEVIKKDPEALNKAGRVIIMGGAYFKQYADWNVMCDVSAADLMFRTLTNLECIGADVTHRLADQGQLENALLAAPKTNPALDYLASLYLKWRQAYPDTQLVMHDALVVYYLYDPAICTMQQIHATVITEGPAKGLTLNIHAYGKAGMNKFYATYDLGAPLLAAVDVDESKFHRYMHRDISAFPG